MSSKFTCCKETTRLYQCLQGEIKHRTGGCWWKIWRRVSFRSSIQNKWYNVVRHVVQAAWATVSVCCQSTASESPYRRCQMAYAVVTTQTCTVTGYLLLSQPALWLCMHVHKQWRLCMCIPVYLRVFVSMYAIFHVQEIYCTSVLCFVCVFVASATCTQQLWCLCLHQLCLYFVKCPFSR